MNYRALRNIIVGLGGPTQGVPRETGFDITAASEVMAILCLSKNYDDLKQRLENILLGLTHDGQPIKAKDLKVSGAMALILKEAIHPNLVQTIDGVPAFIHGGPFANIAHGSNSILATQMALKHADYVVTEAGFAFDLGGEKFMDITTRAGEFWPSACVIVATIRALKMHGGMSLKNISEISEEAVLRGLPNLEKHIENAQKFGVPVIVCLNKFSSDDEKEIEIVKTKAREMGVPFSLSEGFEKGGAGTTELAEIVVDTIENKCKTCNAGNLAGEKFRGNHLYNLEMMPEKKIEIIAKEMYGAIHIDYTNEAKTDLKNIYSLGYDKLAVCMAKTQKSLSDNPKLIGRPRDFTMMVRKIEISAGAGFIVPITGEMMRMPGLPEKPAFENMDIN